MKFKNIILILLLMFISCAGDILEEQENEENGGSKIYIVGGLSGTGIGTTVSGIDVYYPETDSWEQNVATIPIPVSFAAVAVYNSKIFVIGGYTSAGVVSATNQIYDTETGEWSTGSIVNFNARAHIYANIFNGKIYIIGGVANASNNATYSGSVIVQEYNIASDSWTLKTTLAGTASERASVIYNNVIYNFSGRTAVSTLAAVTHDGYSISSNVATTAAEISIPSTRTGTAAVIYRPDNDVAKIIFIGGFTTLTGTNGNYVLNGTTASAIINQGPYYLNYPFTGPPAAPWPTFTNLFPQSVAFGSAVIIDSTLYHFGGTTGHASGVQPSVYSFNVASVPSGSWGTNAAMPVGRIGHTAVVVE